MSNITGNVYSLGYAAGGNARLVLGSLASLTDADPSSLSRVVSSLPASYVAWWTTLVREDPVHVAVETFLILLIVVYLLANRVNRDWKKEMRERLSPDEIEELLKEWRPAPLEGEALAPGERRRLRRTNRAIVRRVKGSRVVVFDDDENKKNAERVVLNMSSYDFLGLASRESLKKASADTLRHYGCGACGPRGFYGTIDVHLDLERAVSEFCGTEAAILYSDGASAATSAVAAFAKRGDLLVVDEAVCEALMTGVTLSRANVRFFRHNDMADLRRVLEKVRDQDERIGRASADQRRFIVVEGLYRNTGRVAPVDDLVDLKTEFRYRLAVDESLAFGTLGTTGKGAVELHHRRPMHHAEIVILSIENALGGVGGVCVGNLEVVDHQRLSGAGYCFSAATPPFTAAAAVESLRILRTEGPTDLLPRLARNRARLYAGLRTISRARITSDDRSVVAFVELEQRDDDDHDDPTELTDRVADECLDQGVMLVSTGHDGRFLHTVPPPAIRIIVTAAHSEEDIDTAVQVLKSAVEKVLGSAGE